MGVEFNAQSSMEECTTCSVKSQYVYVKQKKKEAYRDVLTVSFDEF